MTRMLSAITILAATLSLASDRGHEYFNWRGTITRPLELFFPP